jgi:hypothetical protein
MKKWHTEDLKTYGTFLQIEISQTYSAPTGAGLFTGWLWFGSDCSVSVQ